MGLDGSLRITEIFFSLQGETARVGLPTVFIRLTGCPLRCTYCDSAYAFYGGERYALSEILTQVSQFQAHYVTVTGGEPLAQPGCFMLLSALCDAGYHVSLETSGALSIADVDERVMRVVDVKTPGSACSDKNLLTNFDHLLAHDQLKFVICNREDYNWSKQMLVDHQLLKRCEVLFSPSYQQLDNRELAEWILQDGLAVRFQLQMHKYVWGDVPGK